MIYLYVRKIGIDVVGNDPFISIAVEKVITDSSGKVLQTIGGFDRIYEKASSIPTQPAHNLADDGVIAGIELFNLVAGAAYMWIMSKHGGEMINGRLVIEK
jgi:hypothetical protein